MIIFRSYPRLFIASKCVNFTIVRGGYFYQWFIIHAMIHITVPVFINNHCCIDDKFNIYFK